MNFTSWHAFLGVASVWNEAEALFEAPEVLFASVVQNSLVSTVWGNNSTIP